jgi:hypothetical protein
MVSDSLFLGNRSVVVLQRIEREREREMIDKEDDDEEDDDNDREGSNEAVYRIYFSYFFVVVGSSRALWRVLVRLVRCRSLVDSSLCMCGFCSRRNPSSSHSNHVLSGFFFVSTPWTLSKMRRKGGEMLSLCSIENDLTTTFHPVTIQKAAWNDSFNYRSTN